MARVFTITEGLENLGAIKTGGQGSVYKGRRMGEIFTAIKILPTPIHSESEEDKNFRAFQNEVQKLKKVNEQANPNIVKIISSGLTDSGNLPFIEMEFIEGPDLEELIKPPHEPVFTIREVIKVAEQLSSALAHCHRLDVKHGDIKSNNVKFNIQTGNYVLLDFGLAIMSDEQRRSSLRHAGAIEFMAPEQNDGQMLFETDVYSFGVVLFELLAGQVPFKLTDKGETARNLVMVAHMENTPPDMLALRHAALPLHWSAEKKQAEMQVPQWLVQLVYRCLEKQPANRFTTGIALQQYIATNTIGSVQYTGETQAIRFLQQQVNQLRSENEQLRKRLDQAPTQPTTLPAYTVEQIAPAYTSIQNEPAYPNQIPEAKKESRTGAIVLALLLTLAAVAAIYFFVLRDQTNNQSTGPKTDSLAKTAVVGQYIVTAPKAYFYNEPEENTRRNAYAIASDEVINARAERNGFIYTEITNERGVTSKGWLRLRDLMAYADWLARKQQDSSGSDQLSDEAISIGLNEARVLMNVNKTEEAIDKYKELSDNDVPEAMYEYANLALQGRHTRISCNDAFELLTRLSDNGYVPAKRTLGFLYTNAGDDKALAQYNYTRCNFIRDVPKGSKLLLEAVVGGDTTARRWLDELNARNRQERVDTGGN